MLYQEDTASVIEFGRLTHDEILSKLCDLVVNKFMEENWEFPEEDESEDIYLNLDGGNLSICVTIEKSYYGYLVTLVCASWFGKVYCQGTQLPTVLHLVEQFL